MIACECHNCDEVTYAPNAAAGTKIACPKCGAAVKVPDPAKTPTPAVRVEHPGLQGIATAWFVVKWCAIIALSLWGFFWLVMTLANLR